MEAVRRSAIWRFVQDNWLLCVGILAILLPTMAFVAKETWSTEQGGHGPIVLSTGLWLLVRQWPQDKSTLAPPPAYKVALFFVPLLLLYLAARVIQIVEIEGFVMYALLVVTLYSFAGFAVLQRLWFPLFYLLFTFPPPESVVAAVTQPLKIGISQAAIDFLYWLGYPIAGAGVTIQISQYQLLVAEACAGLNSLISLSAISLFYVYMRHQMNWRYAMILMLAVIPVAIFANFVRVLVLILLTYYAGEAAAQGFLHNFAGLTMFVTALLAIFAIDALAGPLLRRLLGGDSRSFSLGSSDGTR
ncbi:exosortase V [Sphingobium boeckii]|uniref:Exosortase n=1 Tax=Sphingobium boeckii TaxID=1082345 RepID=A0A7W9AJJ8_9SPHN|nr:exosortase V [Sphingobium boeckii]MBB5686641.1 exosortase [Sphingobium boeckii]